MRCSQFLNRYTDFRDGLIDDPAVVRELENHLRGCGRCARYHYAITHGVVALRALGEIEPSPAFRRELQARLAGAVLRARSGSALTPAGLAAAILLATAGAMLVYESLVAGRRAELAEVAHPVPIVIANPGVPFVSFTAADAVREAPVVVPASNPRPGGEWGAIAP